MAKKVKKISPEWVALIGLVTLEVGRAAVGLLKDWNDERESKRKQDKKKSDGDPEDGSASSERKAG